MAYLTRPVIGNFFDSQSRCVLYSYGIWKFLAVGIIADRAILGHFTCKLVSSYYTE